jgi:hypothetical protein
MPRITPMPSHPGPLREGEGRGEGSLGEVLSEPSPGGRVQEQPLPYGGGGWVGGNVPPSTSSKSIGSATYTVACEAVLIALITCLAQAGIDVPGPKIPATPAWFRNS